MIVSFAMTEAEFLAGLKTLRLYLNPCIRLEVSIGGEVIEIPQAELIAALKERP